MNRPDPWRRSGVVTLQLFIGTFLTGCAPDAGETTNSALRRDASELMLTAPSAKESSVVLSSNSILVTAGHGAEGKGNLWEGETGEIGSRWVRLEGYRPVSIATANCTAGTKPVLHLFDLAGREVTADSAPVGSNARIIVVPDGTGWFRIVTRAFDNDGHGRCDLVKAAGSITRLADDVPFGGFFVRMLHLRKDEILETVRMPGSLGRYHAMYILNSDRVRTHTVAQFGGVDGATRYRLPRKIGSRWVMVGAFDSVGGGSIRLVRNDLLPGHDEDGDGLGRELEKAVGTCESLMGSAGNFECSRASDPRDTDGDGLSDGWELLGKGDEYPHQPLPAWGANPRHKDLFVEVDFMQTEPGELVRRMSQADAREFAGYYQAEVPNLSPWRAAYNAAVLNNPDGLPGIAVHLDTGRTPYLEKDQTLYGDWGGHDTVPPVQRNGKWVGQSSEEAYPTHMTAARRGIFHYALGYRGRGGQAESHSVHGAIPLDSMLAAAHEFGHTLGLGHSGPAKETSVDPNCKPNYPSIMNYGYLVYTTSKGIDVDDVGFHDGIGRPAMNDLALQERNRDFDDRYFDHLEHVFRYNVDRQNGHVDFNRNGYFDVNPVAAYANFSPEGGGCEWTRYNQLSVGARAVGSPALVRVDDVTFLLYAREDGKLGHASSKASFDCPEAGNGCHGATWKVRGSRGDDVAAADAIRVELDGASYVLAVTASSSGALEKHLLGRLGNQLVRLGTWPIASSPTQGEPTLARLPDGSAMLGYRGTDGVFYTQEFVDGYFQGEVRARTTSGLVVQGLSANASPSLAFVSVPDGAGSGTNSFVEGLYAAVVKGTSNGLLSLYRYEHDAKRWQHVTPWEIDSTGWLRPRDVWGKPAMAYVPGDVSMGRAPRFYLLYATDEELRMQMSFAEGIAAGAVAKVGLDAPFDNAWYEASGVDLLFEPGVDTNLRSVATMTKDGSMNFRPNADGIIGHQLVGRNDWEVLAVDICRVLAEAAPGAGSRIQCPDWKW